MTEARVVLRLTDVVKTFPGVVALKGVSLEVVEGEVHALLGENGAGKSTLMAVAAGSTRPTRASSRSAASVIESPRPPRAQALGLAVVYQHPSVLDDLTVAENILFAMPPAGGRRCCAHGLGAPSSLPRSAPRIDPRDAGRRAERRRTPARRDRQGARARAEGARARRADRGADAPSRASSSSSRSRDHGRAAPRSSTSRTACPRSAHRRPHHRPPRRGAARHVRPRRASPRHEILELIIGRAVDQRLPAQGRARAPAASRS